MEATHTVAIRCEKLGKVYRIAASEEKKGNRLIRAARSLASPFAWLSQQVRSASEDELLWAVRDVNLTVNAGDVVGLVGSNGAGKSTLLKLLSRITEPSEGRAIINGTLASLLEVGTGMHPELTGRENIYVNGCTLGMTKKSIDRKYDEIVEFSGVDKFLNTPVKRYSSGMRVRLGFAIAAHLEPDILVIDEVLAVGDIAFQRKCLAKMHDVSQAGRTVLFVSHNMDAVRRLCTRGILMKDGRCVMIDGIDPVVAEYERASFEQFGDNSGVATDGFLYRASNVSESNVCRILSIRMFDNQGNPIERLRTWDPVRFELTFHSPSPFLNGAAVLGIGTYGGQSVFLSSTYPDHTVEFDIPKGRSTVSCAFERFPLASGEYTISAALAVPNVQYLIDLKPVCGLSVGPRDVFQSGLAPNANRFLVVTPHQWNVNG